MLTSSTSIRSRDIPLQRRHNGREVVSNDWRFDCLFNSFFRCRSKKTSKLRVTGLCEGNSPMTGEFPSQRSSNAEDDSISWRLHALHRNITKKFVINMCLNIHIYVTAICPFLPRVLNNDIPAFGKIKLHICRSLGIRWIYTFKRTHCNMTLLFYHNLSVTVRWKQVNRVAPKVSPGLSFSHSVSREHLTWIIVPREYSIMNRWGQTSWCLFSMGITRLNARYLPTFCRQFF